MKKYSKLIVNSIYFALGNASSKILLLLLLPLYTRTLTSSDFGFADLITTTVTIVLPILYLAIYEATFRFSIDDSKNPFIIVNSFKVLNYNSIVLLLISPVLYFLNFDILTIILIMSIIYLQGAQTIFGQYARALGRVKLFALLGGLKTLVLLISNIVFLLVFNLGITGYLASIVVAYFTITIIYYIFFGRLLRNNNKIDIKLLKEMLKYSIPLIPSSIIWWLTAASSKYFILFYNGIDENGLYAAAIKIPSIITLFSMIFWQAWQISAITEFESTNSKIFFTNIFKYFNILLIFVTIALQLVIYPISSFIFSETFYNAWKLVPFLLTGVLFSGVASFIEIIYIIKKQTRKILKTNIYVGVCVIILNFLLIPKLEGIGAGIATTISFFILFIVRYFDTLKYDVFSINIYKILISYFLIILSSYFIVVDEVFINFKVLGISMLLIMIYFKDIIYFIFNVYKEIKKLIMSKSKKSL